jgi:chromosome partitioning protein
MRRIAVLNQKGGVGKTTTVANLGAALAAADSSLLLLDLDPQAHLTMHYGVELSERQPSIYEVLCEGVPLADAVVEARPNVGLVPARTDLAAAELELTSVVGREVLLRQAMSALDGAFDVALIDCPPSLSVLTVNALAAVDEVIIPLQAHFLALQGLGKLLETVTLARERINPRLRVSGIVVCMLDTGTRLAVEVLEDVERYLERSRSTDNVCRNTVLYRTRIRRNIKLAESPSFGQTVFEYAPQSNGALDYTSLAGEVLLQGATERTVGLDAAPGASPPPPGDREEAEDAAPVDPVAGGPSHDGHDDSATHRAEVTSPPVPCAREAAATHDPDHSHS